MEDARFLWDFHLLSSCYRHLICMFVVVGNICRKSLKQMGFLAKRLKTGESKRYEL
jgi:hypothetical protein